ncbi:hypothetical protein [Paludisphaera rhizosphaerae]|uniref:hypothetical protein n=1 Tax=Paludisphaera rhizosphaerae TaxID=2711216 RepID=UPI0013EBE775|nr:hypothetical protein [Paludisphaera rhizosphaerae]
MTRMIACILLSVAGGFAARAEDAPGVFLKLNDPNPGDRIVKGTEMFVRVGLVILEGAEPPHRIDVDFVRDSDRASAGQFTESPVKLTRIGDTRRYFCAIKVKTPTSSGPHTLKVTARGKSGLLPTDPSTTMILKETASDVWTFSNPVKKPVETKPAP